MSPALPSRGLALALAARTADRLDEYRSELAALAVERAGLDQERQQIVDALPGASTARHAARLWRELDAIGESLDAVEQAETQVAGDIAWMSPFIDGDGEVL